MGLRAQWATGLIVAALSTTCASRTTPAPERAVEYEDLLCRVDGVAVRLHRAHARRRAGVELRVLANPTARRNESCRHSYGGEDLLAVARRTRGLRLLAATNGYFFHFTDRGAERSNGFLWSRVGRTGAGEVLSPLEPTIDPDMRGDRLVVADDRGLHELRMSTGDAPCAPGACRVSELEGEGKRVVAAGSALDERTLVTALRSAFPRMTSAMQMVPALGDAPAGSDPLAPAWRCPEDRNAPDAWKCERQPVAILCGHADGSVSLLAAEPARYAELARGLREGGSCGIGCRTLSFMDGGRSTQIAAVGDDGALTPRWAMFLADRPAAGCGRLRPVHHYVALGLPNR